MSYIILNKRILYCMGGVILTVAIRSNMELGLWKAYQGFIPKENFNEADVQRVSSKGGKLSKELALAYFPELPAEQNDN